MTNKIKYIVLISALISVGWGQLKSALPENRPYFNEVESNDNSIMSLFDPSRFSMNHSFSMSMLSMNNQSIGVASYTNNMNFLLRDNLHLRTYLTFMQPNILSADTQNPYSNNQVYFDAELDYQPTQNSHIKVSFGNYPAYSRYNSSPFFLTRGY